MPFRILGGILGAFFLLQGLQWLGTPEAAAGALGMPLLDGMGRSTQIGDISGFFLCLGGFALYGAYRQNGTWLRAAGILLGLVGVTRTIAWLAHDAPFAAVFISVEFIGGALLTFCAMRIEAAGEG